MLYTIRYSDWYFSSILIKVAKEELSRECDYELEAASQKRFRDFLSDSEGFYVPMVIDEISSKKVLTTELITGKYVIFIMTHHKPLEFSSHFLSEFCCGIS